MKKTILLHTFVLLAMFSSQANLQAQNPAVQDVYAATLVSTTTAPQSAVVHFEGTGTTFNSLTYNVVDGPNHGTLGVINGSTVSYTPTANFVGMVTNLLRPHISLYIG